MRKISIWTDGSCIVNPGGPGGWAAIVCDGGRMIDLVGHAPATTNNRMEILAAIKGLESLTERSRVTLYSDSQYVVKAMTLWIGGWKRRGFLRGKNRDEPVPNRDLWEALDAAALRHDVTWQWVRGHNGNSMNERVDELARRAAKRLPA